MERDRKRKLWKITAAVSVGILVILAVVLLIRKYMPTGQKMSGYDYFKTDSAAENDSTLVILDNEILYDKGRYIDGRLYLQQSFVQDNVNMRFYYDKESNAVLYSDWSAVYTYYPDVKGYRDQNGNTYDTEYEVIKTADGVIYIDFEYMAAVSNISYKYAKEPQRLVLHTTHEEQNEVTIRKKVRSVKADMCSGCGICTEKCPSRKTPSEFDMGLKNRGAIYIPFAQAIPKVPVIDREACIKFKTGKCGICSKVCPAGAIDYTQTDELITEKYGAIVLATGFKTLPLDKFGEYGYGASKDVITSLELERLTNAAGPTEGHLVCPSTGKEPKKVIIVSCVGSRDVSGRGKSYCSKICCMYNAKHAMYIREKYPDVDLTVFYIDVRTPGKGFDEFQRRAVEEYGVHYVRGQVGKVVVDGDGKLTVFASDLNSGRKMMLNPDLVVLATAVQPSPDARKLATMLTASIDNDDFYVEAHPKLRPVESPTAGIFLSGMCQGPKDIPETVSQAGAAAVKVVGLLAKDKLLTNPCTAQCDTSICSGCLACTHVCPYGAITGESKQVITKLGVRETRTVAVVNNALCQGCGACTVACPCGAMDLQGFTNQQILAEVDALC